MGGSESEAPVPETDVRIRREPHWPGVLFQLYISCSIIYGLVFLPQAKVTTVLFTLFLIAAGSLGSTAGAHRLWAHRSYSANALLRVILMICQTLSGDGPIYDWVLDHRLHHQLHATDDDCYNHKKGFIYAHFKSRILTEHPKREELLKQINMKDIKSDGVVMFQKRFYWILMPIINLLLTINAPVEYWDEDIIVSAMIVGSLRVPISLHLSWLINSAQAIWALHLGDRFYSNSNMIFVLSKSYWHEYHYAVPWDCLTNEFGSYNNGFATAFIKICAALGWAHNLRTIPSKGIRAAMDRAIETHKPIRECINEIAEEFQNCQQDDEFLNLLKSKVYK